MGVIKVDPKQNKAAAALIIILIAAVSITIMRIMPAQPKVAKTTAESSSTESEIEPGVEFGLHLDHNPFMRPAALIVTSETIQESDEQNTVDEPKNMGLPPWMPAGSQLIAEKEQSASQHPEQSGKAGNQNGVQTEKMLPSLTLLATVRGSGGLFAIIRIGDSETRTIGVGEALVDGFKLQELDNEHAVLTNGRDTIIAKRSPLK